MEFTTLIDREAEQQRLETALARETPQFIVVYGRRRIGKSTLIKHILAAREHAVYFLSDATAEALQRAAFARSAAMVINDFDKAIYQDWESLFRSLNRQLTHRIAICIDEFPYLVKSCEALPSILQKLLNEKSLKFDLILCGSSQQLMHGYVLNRQAPLYGLANEIIRMRPLAAKYACEAFACDARQAIEEYSIWGGIPRYWELRRDYPDLRTAIRKVLLDTQGPLNEEPQRLLRDDMRDTIQATTLLTIVGNGVNRLSEIASRAGKDASSISEPLAKLRDLGYITREIPFGESPKSSKRGIYHVNDNVLRFYYRFIAPYHSILEIGKVDTVMQLVEEQMPQIVGACWEELCRNFVSGSCIDGIVYNAASRWWGRALPMDKEQGDMLELDVVAESIDKKHILIGECKWTRQEDAERLMAKLEKSKPRLPFVKKGQQVHLALFLKEPPLHQNQYSIYLPEDILQR